MLWRASLASSSTISGGGGGSRTSIESWQSAVPPRPSSTWPVTEYCPAFRPEVSNFADLSLPLTFPPLAFQERVNGSLSGSLAIAVTSTVSPINTELRSAEQLIVGGRLGRGFTRISAEHSAVPLGPASTRTRSV